MLGKDKCKILKEIRAQIAAANEIEWVTENCTHKGDCRGTCPKCEAEVAALERALARRRALGKTVAVAGLSAGMIVSTSACALIDSMQSTGGVMVIESERTTTVTTTTTMTTKTPQTHPPGAISYVPEYYYTDFVLQDARLFEAKETFYAYGIIVDEEVDSPRGINIPAGARFEVVGEMSEDYMWLLFYENAYYCTYSDENGEVSFEVTDETDSGESVD